MKKKALVFGTQAYFSHLVKLGAGGETRPDLRAKGRRALWLERRAKGRAPPPPEQWVAHRNRGERRRPMHRRGRRAAARLAPGQGGERRPASGRDGEGSGGAPRVGTGSGGGPRTQTRRSSDSSGTPGGETERRRVRGRAHWWERRGVGWEKSYEKLISTRCE
ncbi:hypothetical protein BS78_02G286700 [Paspalum vaginatum]|nr:hypothetical protein BS78_02G286700 [Paspalum vaginatum]